MSILDRINRVFDNNLSASPNLLEAFAAINFDILDARLNGDREDLPNLREVRKEIRDDIRAERADFLQDFKDARDEAREKVADAREEVAAAREALREARSEGREAVEEAREVLNLARDSMREARAELGEARDELQQARADWKDGSAGSDPDDTDGPIVGIEIDDDGLITFPDQDPADNDNTGDPVLEGDQTDDFIAAPIEPDMDLELLLEDGSGDQITDLPNPEPEMLLG